MHETELSVLGLPVTLRAHARLAGGLLAALAPRVSVGTPGSEVGPRVTYELRDTSSGLDVVRLDASSCELIDAVRAVDAAAEMIAGDVHRWVAEHHPTLVLVHAGVVEWQGAGVLLPGRSHTGKSSLVAALLVHGATYLSDEFAPIDHDGDVHPYPRDLSIRGDDGASSLIPASTYTSKIAAGPVTVRYVVDARYERGATFEPDRLHGAPALLTVAENALVARSRPAHTMAVLAALAPHVTVLRSSRGEADAAASAILQAIDADARTTP